MKSFPSAETIFLLPGPAGNLEVATTSNLTRQATAIICHPHPLYKGTMNNKVVTTLMRAFQNLGLNTVRFNFRGVGKSEGQYGEGRGELEDLLAVIHWVREVKPQDEIWLAGFSFGAFITIQAASQMPVAQLISVAPPVPYFSLPNLSITCPWLLIQGDKDDLIPSEKVIEWVNTLHPKPYLITIPDAGHFFHGKLIVLREAIEKRLQG